MADIRVKSRAVGAVAAPGNYVMGDVESFNAQVDNMAETHFGQAAARTQRAEEVDKIVRRITGSSDIMTQMGLLVVELLVVVPALFNLEEMRWGSDALPCGITFFFLFSDNVF